MIARRDFRHDAAEFFVLRNLRRHFAREQSQRSPQIATAVSSHEVSIARIIMSKRRHSERSRGIPMKLP